jgi:hypothetical protein
MHCLIICSLFGGDLTYPGPGLKYLTIIRCIFHFLRVFPELACFSAGTPKAGIEIILWPRLISIIGCTVLLFIDIIASLASFRNEYFVEIGVIVLLFFCLPLLLWDLFFHLAIKSYSIQPPKEHELSRLNSSTKCIPYQPVFILAQHPSSTMIIPGNQLGLMQGQNNPQQINPQPNSQQMQPVAQNPSQQINPQPNAQQIQQVAQSSFQQVIPQPNAQQVQREPQNPSQQINSQPNPQPIQQIGQNPPQQIIPQPNTQQILVSQQQK